MSSAILVPDSNVHLVSRVRLQGMPSALLLWGCPVAWWVRGTASSWRADHERTHQPRARATGSANPCSQECGHAFGPPCGSIPRALAFTSHHRVGGAGPC